MTDVTDRYSSMIESFECDFNLAAEGEISLSILQESINKQDPRLMQDIELLREMSYAVRHGKVKIMHVE